MERCPNCNHLNPWQTGEAQLGRLGSNIRVWAQVTECSNCGFHYMTDQQIDDADQQLLALENTYNR